MSRQIVIYVAAHAQQAHLLKNLLAGYGIEARVQNEMLSGAVEDVNSWSSAPRVTVAPEDSEFAREVAEEFDAKVRRRAGQGPDDAGLPAFAENWPHCPHCRRPRQTECPACGTAGHRFPVAEFVGPPEDEGLVRLRGDDEDDELLVICPTCDEPFTPKFYRHCEACDYDFGHGRVIEREQFSTEQWQRAKRMLVGCAFVAFWLWLIWRFLMR